MYVLPPLMQWVNLYNLGEQNDEGEMGRLLQLILGCAVNCDDKQEYIQRIMSMEESVQHVVMNAIQEVRLRALLSIIYHVTYFFPWFGKG